MTKAGTLLSYLAQRAEFRQQFGIEKEGNGAPDIDAEEEEKSLLKILDEITDPDPQTVVDWVCCEDIRQTDVDPSVEHVLAMGGNVIDVPVYTAKIVEQLLSSNRRIVLTIAGGIGRLTPVFLERVESAFGQFSRDSDTGNVCLAEASKVAKSKKSKPAPSVQIALDFSRLGAKREEVEVYLSEADLYLEIILRLLTESIQRHGIEVLIRDRHDVAHVPGDFKGLLVLMDTCSTNSGQNVEHAKELLLGAGLVPSSLKTALLQVPMLQRRAMATAGFHLGCELTSMAPRGPVLREQGSVERALSVSLAWGEMRRIRDYSARQPPFFHLPKTFSEEMWEGVQATRAAVQRAEELLTKP